MIEPSVSYALGTALDDEVVVASSCACDIYAGVEDIREPVAMTCLARRSRVDKIRGR